MRKTALSLVLLFIWGCSFGTLHAKVDEEKQREYFSLEVTLSDMSKKITGHYGSEGKTVPPDFDERQFIALLERIYPDKSRVERIRDGYRIKARAVVGGYAVILCDRETGNKLLEDLSCTLDKVDIRHWDRETAAACEFESDWKSRCR